MTDRDSVHLVAFCNLAGEPAKILWTAARVISRVADECGPNHPQPSPFSAGAFASSHSNWAYLAQRGQDLAPTRRCDERGENYPFGGVLMRRRMNSRTPGIDEPPQLGTPANDRCEKSANSVRGRLRGEG